MAKQNKQPQTVITQLIIKAPQRKVFDVGEWRKALISADSGRVKRLYDLFDDLLLDGYLSDAFNKRKEAITNAELAFHNAKGEDVPEISKLLDTIAFESLLRIIMDVEGWGRTGVEFDFSDGFHVYEIPKKHINLINKTILINDTDESGIPYEGDDHLLILGDKRKYGLFMRTAPFVIWKRGGFGDWAQWLEIFGMPQRVGKYSMYDEGTRKILEQALSQAGSAPYVVIPRETEVETVNNTGSGSSGVSYNDFRKACNEEILITVLGQTLTTVQGDKGARSLGEVHKEVEESKNRADMRYVQRVLNQYVLPILNARGYPVKGGRFVFPESAEQLSVDEISTLSKILPIPQSFLYDKYSIPTPKNGEPIAGQTSDPKTIEAKRAPSDDKPDPDKKEPQKKKKLSYFFAFAPTKERGFSDRLMKLAESDNLNDRVISRINGGETFDIELFEYFNAQLFEAVQTHIKLGDISFVYGEMDDAYKTAMEINLFHFSAAKTIAEITELNRIFRESKSFDEFYKKAVKVADVFNKRWMQTEYETALLVAESASNYWRLKKKAEIFPYWQYTAVMDGRTRESHANLHCIILPANDERWRKIMPPNGWKCRCRIKALMKHELPEGYNFENARAIVDEYLASDEWKSIAAQGWDTNRAETAEIFTKTQQYINKFPQKGGKFLDDLTAEKWGQEHVPKLMEKAAEHVPKNENTAQEIWDAHVETPPATSLKLKLFNDRQVTLSKKNFDAHTIAKKDDRSVYFDAMKETLENPDELWLNNEIKIDRLTFRKWIIGGKKDDKLAKQLNYDNFSAIKYYKDEVIVVNYKINNGVLELRSWYSMRLKKDIWSKKRRGLFIKIKQSGD